MKGEPYAVEKKLEAGNEFPAIGGDSKVLKDVYPGKAIRNAMID